jgi:hypothetical protein
MASVTKAFRFSGVNGAIVVFMHLPLLSSGRFITRFRRYF